MEAQTFRKKYNFQGIKRLTGLPRNRQQSVKLSFRGHERPSHYQYKMTLKGHRSAKEKRKKKANAVLIKSHFKKFRLKLKYPLMLYSAVQRAHIQAWMSACSLTEEENVPARTPYQALLSIYTSTEDKWLGQTINSKEQNNGIGKTFASMQLTKN